MHQTFVVPSPTVAKAIKEQVPIVALESTIISHGMPYPQNLNTALALEEVILARGAVPATIAIMGGQIKVGLQASEIEQLAKSRDVQKVSRRDFARVLAEKKLGATTVAGTMIACQLAGIKVFATGGIGGIHRGVADSWDISNDLTELGATDVAVVSAGIKSILDIPKTLEALETLGVPVLTWRTDEFPAFYHGKSGYKLGMRVDSAAEVAAEMRIKWQLNLRGGMLIAVPIPEQYALDAAETESLIAKALHEASSRGITGKSVTPFLLATIAEASGGDSLEANIALVKNNAAVAAEIAVAFSKR